MSVGELLAHINEKDALVAEAVRQTLPQIEALIRPSSMGTIQRMKKDDIII